MMILALKLFTSSRNLAGVSQVTDLLFFGAM
ncbi:hypothetical protein LINPERPRIM_LOCUS26318 [Linum perenne]